MQVRTLFMHAWAEPQHDLGYKPGEHMVIDRNQRRRLAWIAASSWGADQMLNDVARTLGSAT
jgi:putative GTP pyrophosphokinase